MEAESKETGFDSVAQAAVSGKENAKFRVCIAGAGFAGAILARQLEKEHEDVEVVLFERVSR
jgi:cation diffusion facilitator CzcD-associated flavoprotein CzcO